MLLYIVPTQRGAKIRESGVNYLTEKNPKSDIIEDFELLFEQ